MSEYIYLFHKIIANYNKYILKNEGIQFIDMKKRMGYIYRSMRVSNLCIVLKTTHKVIKLFIIALKSIFSLILLLS